MKKPRSEKWYESMKNRRTSNQYLKAKELDLPKPVYVRTKSSFSGKKHTEETKLKISEKMKQAHAEGRAWNLGKNRWENKPSYPEQFFMSVIENEFEDKNYEYNMYFHGFWLDFAWPHLKTCIEIDGKQHVESIQQIERDKRKDKLLEEHGWKLLRISWKEMCRDTKTYIELSKNFVTMDTLP